MPGLRDMTEEYMSNEFTAKTVDEAVAKGLSELGITLEEAEVKVIEEPVKGGLFGIGAKPAKVTVQKKKSDADAVVDFLSGLLKIMNVNTAVELTEENEERAVFNLTAVDSSALIGYRGEVLDSIQCLAGAVYNTEKEKYIRVVVDCEGYRDKREKTLVYLANKLAAKAVKTGRKICLEPMNPYERRIIHAALMNYEGVKTMSEGKEPTRYVAIIPDNYDPTKAPDKKSFREKRFDKNGKFDKRSGGRFDRNNRRGGKFDKGDRNGEKRAPKKAGFGGGVFLGNSLKDTAKEEKTEE